MLCSERWKATENVRRFITFGQTGQDGAQGNSCPAKYRLATTNAGIADNAVFNFHINLP
jgi:hypothetical protein